MLENKSKIKVLKPKAANIDMNSFDNLWKKLKRDVYGYTWSNFAQFENKKQVIQIYQADRDLSKTTSNC